MRDSICGGVVASVPVRAIVPAFAEIDKFHITPEEHAACAQDAARLCSDAYPDEEKLLDCMRARHNQLTPVCSIAFRSGLRKRHIKM